MLASYVHTQPLLLVMCTVLFVGMAHDVHAGAACADTFGSQTIASRDCGAAHNVSNVDSGGGRYRPADPQAMPVVRNVLNWLNSLPSKTTKKIMSGQIHASIINDIHTQTGYWPALLGGAFDKENKWDDFEEAVSRRQAMLDHWNNGGLVSVYMLVGNPKNKTGMRDTDFSDADMVAVVTPGTKINANYDDYLHTFAVHARWLSDQGAPLMVRPLFEMNCCFWYGRKSFESYKTLYQYTFDYLTRTENLHNLIFQWGPSTWNGAGKPDSNYVDYYPGDAYVDIVGLDAYIDVTGSSVITGHDLRACPMLAALGKIFAFNEFGPQSATSSSSARRLSQADDRHQIILPNCNLLDVVERQMVDGCHLQRLCQRTPRGSVGYQSRRSAEFSLIFQRNTLTWREECSMSSERGPQNCAETLLVKRTQLAG